MAHAPVDVAIIGFPGNKFTGRIAPALAALVEDGTIRLLDLLFVSKDADGTVTSFHIADLDGDGTADLATLEITEAGVLSQEDAEEVADDLAPNSSAALIAWENVWASRLVGALREADAVLIDQIRIPAAVVDAVLAP